MCAPFRRSNLLLFWETNTPLLLYLGRYIFLQKHYISVLRRWLNIICFFNKYKALCILVCIIAKLDQETNTVNTVTTNLNE